MMQPTLHHLACPDAQGSHRMAYWSWGPIDHPHVVVCVHGLTRQGRDFDVLAQALVGEGGQRCRVVSVDIVGRGQSDWLKDPMAYQLPTYGADMLALLAHLRASGTVQTVDWMGTSMGGLIGMAVAAQPASGLRKLVLNDVGPALELAALQRIGTYVGMAPHFDSEQAAVDYLWLLSSTFGPHTPEQWLALSRPMLRQVGGQWCLHYDPAMALPFKSTTEEATRQNEALLWKLYDTITADTLLTRGAQSDLLSPATAQAMTQRGPKARLVEFEGVGHAPTFVANNQVDTVTSFIFGA
ncbi:MAG: alpha/beta hydrolase [Burkholderiaceae bacterium]